MGRSSNDDRSDTLNPNNDAYWAAQANQGGDSDDWDDEDYGGDPRPTCEMDLHPKEIKIESIPATAPASLRQQCGPLVIDRQSHYLRSFLSILDMIWDHKFETPESVRARSEKRSNGIVRLKAEISELESKIENYVPKRNDWGDIRDEKPDLERQRDWRRDALVKEWEWVVGERSYSSDRNGWRFAGETIAPQLQSSGWRELFDWLASSLSTNYIETTGAFAMLFDARFQPVYPPPEGVLAPAKVESKAFGSNEELFQFVRGIKPQFNEGQYKCPNQIIRAMAFPQSETPKDTKGMPRDECLRILGSINWLLTPCVDTWDIRPMLRAVINAATASEWAGAPYCVFGIKYGWTETCVSDYRCSRSQKQARLILDGFLQRGFRAIMVETPIVSSPVSWDKNHENAEFWKRGTSCGSNPLEAR